ncbi:sulfite reductase flavoprotein subunit alpha [uncultured Luteimonas sp.]|uniref:sulfite reductase subunit alpha n=1 Tax=uncultured Luteimonas sp. TaxID=453144 RepID=UPI002621AC10|nr:sulfite reductase flavoprotein subunit alpha [uncultured Luteimonas sp.]
MNAAAANPPPRWRALLGNVAALALLLVAALALLPLHDADWWPASPRPRQWWLAAGWVAAYLGASAWLLRRARPMAVETLDHDAALPWLVVHASQTGFAAALAAQTAAALRAAGLQVALLPLASVDAAVLARTGRALFIVSTTGEGDPPDPALPFVRAAMARPAALGTLQYAVLALGDRGYAHFCAFGHQLEQWLRQCGARALFDLTEVDNGDPGALRHWQHHLAQAAGADAMPDWTPPRYESWTLASRRLLNPGSLGGPAFHLALHPPAGGTPSWQAGDIAEVGPRNPPAEVEQWLAARGLDGAATVLVRGEATPLREALSRSRPPEAGGRVADPQALADALQPLPHREYSIASLPGDGALELLVRQMRRDDGRPGLGSGWLCLHALPGAPVDLRIRSNPNFHPPADPRPLLLIGNGTGIAGLRALLKARERAGARRNWLLFGEREQARDAFFDADLQRWRASGVLERLDAVFSRDPGGPRYVQDALRAAAPALREWIAAGASIYVCGSLEGMAPGVDAVLRETLGDGPLEQLRAQGRYRRDVY